MGPVTSANVCPGTLLRQDGQPVWSRSQYRLASAPHRDRPVRLTQMGIAAAGVLIVFVPGTHGAAAFSGLDDDQVAERREVHAARAVQPRRQRRDRGLGLGRRAR